MENRLEIAVGQDADGAHSLEPMLFQQLLAPEPGFFERRAGC
jgi:hypothetical protein